MQDQMSHAIRENEQRAIKWRDHEYIKTNLIWGEKQQGKLFSLDLKFLSFSTLL